MLVPPSPNCHAHEATDPSASVDVDVKLAVNPLVVDVKFATGGELAGGAVTVTGMVLVPVAPWLSVTVNVTV